MYWQSDRKQRGLRERMHFVNLVEGAGLYGFDGIRKVAGLMIEAWQEEKDPEDLIIRKGWGCESCI